MKNSLTVFLYLYRQLVETVDFSNLVSSVVTRTGMRVVWAWIPERFALFSPIRLFNTAEHGKSLASYVTFLSPFFLTFGKLSVGEAVKGFLLARHQ